MEYLKKVRSIFQSKALNSIWRWSKLVHWGIAMISVIGMAMSLMSLGITLVTKNMIDGATSGKAEKLWQNGIALVALIALERVLSILSGVIRNRSNARLQMEMQRRVTTALMGKEYAAIKPYHSGELVNRVFSDVGVVKNGVMNLIPSILRIIVSFVGAAIILIQMDWRFLPVIIIASILGVMITLVFRDPMKRRHRRMQEAEDALHAATQETIENFRIVKASVSEEHALGQINNYRENLVSEQVRNGRLSIWMQNGMGSVFDLSWLFCNIWGCVKIYQGTFTYGSLAALIQLIGRIQNPIANAVSMVSQVYGVISSAERLMEVIDLPDEEQGTELKRFDRIRMEEMSFQYEVGTDDVLLDINAEIRQGDFVALTGISGGGKTSLFQLMLGIYRPTSGRIVFEDGATVVPACRGTRGLFSYVPQGNTLFSGTIRENLTWFNPAASEMRIREAIRAACLEEIIDEIGLETRLGERGIGLSEGQAQRVAVARALISDAPILLLDEATSALDEATEARLLENISAMRDRTVIIVTHRRAALAICDYQLHIEDGRMKRV